MKASVLKALSATIVVGGMCGGAFAALGVSTQHGPESESLTPLMSSTDLIQGAIGVEQPGDLGWHPANTSPADQLPAFTDGLGNLSGLTGLLNDFPPAGAPTKIVRYAFGGAQNVGTINIFSGNRGKDGRVFSTTVVKYSTDGTAYNTLGYFESDLPGTINSGQWGSTLVSITTGNGELDGIVGLQFEMYAVDNTGGQYRDPFDGVNPFTSIDDGLTAAFSSPLVYEIDVIVPEPATLSIAALGALGLLARRR